MVGLIIPIGKWGAALAGKAAKPGTFLFNLIMYAFILVVMLIFMSPALTVFIGSVLHGAPVIAVLPSSYSLFIPFFLIGIVLIMIVGGPIMKLALKCAGVPKAVKANAIDENSQEKK
ncbi:MAG: hypothetical protein ACOWWH_10545 [Eubacteriaceae bacterium]